MNKKNNRSIWSKMMDSNIAVLLIILVLVVLFFSIMNKNYFTAKNMLSILSSALLPGLMATGMTYLIIGGQIDLSCGAAGAMFGVMTAILLEKNMSTGITVIIVLLCGALVGLVNAVLVNVFDIQPFIATLAMSQVFGGLAYIIGNGRSIPVTNKAFINVCTFKILNIPFPTIIMLILFLVMGFVLARTRFGRSIYMIGGNSIAAEYAGLRPKKIINKLYVINAVIAALAGILATGRMHSGQPTAISGTELDAITVAVLGGVAFTGGTGNMIGCFVGLFVIQCFNTGLSVVGVSAFWQVCAKGALLIFALILDYVRKWRLKKQAAIS